MVVAIMDYNATVTKKMVHGCYWWCAFTTKV